MVHDKDAWAAFLFHRTYSVFHFTHYRRICAVLAETPLVVRRIVETIDAHGGWPLG